MPRYQLLRGMHTQGEDPETGQPIVFKAGSVVESDIDLELRFGSEKFQAVDRASADGGLREELEDLRRQNAELKSKLAEAEGEGWEDDLSSMTLKELRKYAQDHGVSVEGLSTKDEIVEAVKFALEVA
jgi:hypothetical protein